MSTPDVLHDHLAALYGPDEAAALMPRLAKRLDAFRRAHPTPDVPDAPDGFPLTERDAILITYGDQVREPGRPPLAALGEVLTHHTRDFLTGVHLLPFYPYSSDDGFSVIDYTAVDPDLGDWEDVRHLRRSFRLMFDAVINHISAQSEWFAAFRRGEAPYADFFVTADPAADLSAVVRPRALPLLTPVETADGTKHVWTTFSDDQVDLNYANPEVLLAVLDVLLRYVAEGATLLRLDAIAFMWKEVGTRCIHLAQTHRIIQFLRAALESVAPNVLLITETNVPHAENISYFGDGTNEAHLVYQFPLPPLTLYALRTGDAAPLQRWAATLEAPSDRTTFFNFLASHDGIGVRPAEGLLSTEQFDALVATAEAHGGHVSYRAMPDGGRKPYELNINFFDALSDPAALEDGAESLGTQINRFMAAHGILLSLAGVPGIYVHSLFGSRSWHAGVAETGRHRTINREKFDRAALEADLAEPSSLRSRVLARFRWMLSRRAKEPSFHPLGTQRVMPSDPGLFALERTSLDGTHRILCLVNVTPEAQSFPAFDLPLRDLLSPEVFLPGEPLAVPPYGVRWLI